ncbi:MAG: nucleotidyltransferase domain-containing protein [Patescibacteria group bacterium]|mgnify:FL=1
MYLANNNTQQETEIKLAGLKRALPVLLLAPYTRIIFLAGSVAANTAKKESDIDLIMVSKNGRIWLNKCFLEILTRIFNIRRIKNNRENKICFNIFLSNKKPLLPHQDFIGAGCYKNLKPVWYSEKKDLEKFWEDNSWIKKFYNVDLVQEKIFGSDKNIFLIPKKIIEFFLTATGLGIVLEKTSFEIQYRYLKKRFDRTVLNKNSAEYDLFLTPNLIAYHFPVSNYARVLKLASKEHVEKLRP